jgi:hypothetical protein
MSEYKIKHRNLYHGMCPPGYEKVTGHTKKDGTDEILRELDLPNNGGGEDFEYQDFEGNELNEDEFDKNSGAFSTTIYKNGRYYNLSGAVTKNGKKWVAGAEIEEVEF